ncbi:50S ribosomal protein L23 [Magnetococcales bacterium HHB-1]
MSDPYTLYQVLMAPHVTEKATLCLERSNQVAFKVAPWANKVQIKMAVEKLFKVDVVSVKTYNVKGKKKRFGQIQGQRKDWKKALVRLKEEQSVDFFPEG